MLLVAHGVGMGGSELEVAVSPPPSPQRTTGFKAGNRISGFTSLNRTAKVSSKSRTMK